MSSPEYDAFIQRMKKAQGLNEKRTTNWARQGYPIVIDTTGRDFSRIRDINAKLRSINYDTSLVFINTSLKTAQSRNQLRQKQGEHGADNDYLIQAWYDSQSNIDAYKNWFGEDKFVLINNDADVQKLDPINYSKFLKTLSSAALKILGRPFNKEEIRRKIELNKNV